MATFHAPVFAGMAALLAGASTPALAEDPPSRGELIERGRYLAEAGNCASCHTTEDGKPYAGGYALETPFGTLLGPNITPDPKTGIGDWDRETFAASMRQGLGDEGEALYPGMPYLHYTKMTDADIDALWAYMQSLEPVENAVAVNQLPFPFDVRESLWAWRALYFEPGRFQPDPDAPERIERGRYLVEAVAHCGSCHTPRDALGGPETDKALQGARLGDWYAPDISNGVDSAIAHWDVAELSDYLMEDHADVNVTAVGRMAHVTDGLAGLRREDVEAMSAYLLSREPAPGATEAPKAADTGAADAQALAAGADLYATHCRGCHGPDGEGAPGVASSLTDSGGVAADQPVNVITATLEGVPPVDEYGVMPSYADTLSDLEIAAVTNFIRTSWGNDAPANATRSMVATLRAEVDEPDPAVLKANACPTVPADHLDPQTRARIAEMVRTQPDHMPGMDALETIWDGYLERVADVDRSARVTALHSAYCLEMAGLDEVSRREVLTRTVTFSAKVGEVAVDGG